MKEKHHITATINEKTYDKVEEWRKKHAEMKPTMPDRSAMVEQALEEIMQNHP